MIPFVIPAVLKRIPAWLWIALAVVLIAILALVYVDRRDKSIADTAVRIDRDQVNVEALGRVLEAERKAAAKQDAREEKLTIEKKELSDEAAKGDTSGVGPGLAATIERVRRQQIQNLRTDTAR